MVISCGPDGRSEWKPGSLQRFQSKITSSTTGGQSVTFHLFDHVTVSPYLREALDVKYTERDLVIRVLLLWDR